MERYTFLENGSNTSFCIEGLIEEVDNEVMDLKEETLAELL